MTVGGMGFIPERLLMMMMMIVVFTAFIKPGRFQGRDQQQDNNRCRCTARTGKNQTKKNQKVSYEAVSKSHTNG